MGGLQAAIEQLAVKFPEPRDPLQESRYTRERDSLQARLDGLGALQSNYEYYLDEDGDINWGSDGFAHRERATQTMKEYAEAKNTESALGLERSAVMGRANAAKDQVRGAKTMQGAQLESVNAATTRMKKARTELFKAQEELNAAKGGWLIDRVPGSGGNWWVVTKNGYAFPTSLQRTVRHPRDLHWRRRRRHEIVSGGLTARERLKHSIVELPSLSVEIQMLRSMSLKSLFRAYEPPWSPFASPAAFTSEGRQTAQTPEAKAQLAQARQAAQRDDAQARAIRATLGQRLGAAAGHDRPLTLNELRAYGVGPCCSACLVLIEPGSSNGSKHSRNRVPAAAPPGTRRAAIVPGSFSTCCAAVIPSSFPTCLNSRYSKLLLNLLRSRYSKLPLNLLRSRYSKLLLRQPQLVQ